MAPPADAAPQVGVGAAAEPALPATVAEAEATYAETVRKCRLLAVAAVRDECLRQARRNLDRDLARLKRDPEGCTPNR